MINHKPHAVSGQLAVKSPSDSLTPYFNGSPVLAK
jgi:hypothetical protein